MNLTKLRWYAARLAAMSPREVVHRIGELRKKTGWRANTRGWDIYASIADGPLPDLAFLRERLALGASAAVPALAVLAAGKVSGLGQSVGMDLGDALWLVDPVSAKGGAGKSWPGAARYTFDVDVRSTGAGSGDVKFVWEINRLQFLHPVAAAIAADPDEGTIDAAFGYLESWYRANPPFRGVNWFSGIELAMRLVSLTLLVAALPPAQFTLERRQLVRRLVAAHGFWLERYPSKYSSANNHLVAEGLGLYLAGLLAPDLAHAKAHRDEGARILTREAALQILEDGVGAEQSPTYQAFTMEMIAFAALMGNGMDEPFAPIVFERLRAGATFLGAMMDSAGQVPHIGDDDEGRVIGAPPDREPRYVASVVAAVAGLLHEPELGPPQRDTHIRDSLFGAPVAPGIFASGLRSFPVGGYSVARDTIGGREAVLTFDHGPLGYLSLAAHGHSDALAIWLSLDDQPVIIDAGTYLYHSGGVMRNRLRSSLAHNTLSVEEASQSMPSAAFSWASKAKAQCFETQPGKWWRVGASHDGYRSRFGITHRRTVARTPTGFSVMDQLEGGEKDCTIGFLIAPEIEIQRISDRFVLTRGGTAIAEILTPPSLSARVVRDDRQSGMGLVSPRFGDLVAARQILCSGRIGTSPVMTRIDVIAGT